MFYISDLSSVIGSHIQPRKPQIITVRSKQHFFIRFSFLRALSSVSIPKSIWKMKFGKELVAQMVPEWQETYMNYSYLKSLIKTIQHSKHGNKPHPHHHRLTLYSAFAGLTRSLHHQQPVSHCSDIEDQSIHVHAVESNGGSHESYKTTFLMADEEGGGLELEYFRSLDDEFNKVERFYREKVAEVMKEASVLNKQMDALIAFRIKVDNPQRLFDLSAEITRLASDVAASTTQLSTSAPKQASATS